ncbi:MAG TPA: hypothetical protein VN281_05175 [Verrucomicrobiae bacterium]|jgi:hypothetical protein|nr:hypothetical protein [Verrucomicrobiae bacterium]
MTRRDKCHIAGTQAQRLDEKQSAIAWHLLAGELVELGDADIPKFRQLMMAIRSSTILARRPDAAHRLFTWRARHS